MLVEKARAVRKNAYAPYYNVYVGAALLTEDESIYVGCNVENAAGGAHNGCAEANAIAAAVADGKQNFVAIAVVGSENQLTFPCGVCRQKMAEFSKEMDIYLAPASGPYKQFRLSELFPHPMKI